MFGLSQVYEENMEIQVFDEMYDHSMHIYS